jgi:hypothetical protein
MSTKGRKMSDPISKIELKLWTSTRSGSSTDGRVYLGLAGREYSVSRGDIDNFQPSRDPVSYVFGNGANVERPQDNDPRSPWQTDAREITTRPMYIRFAPNGDDDNWDLERADLTIFFKGTSPGSIEQQIPFSRLSGGAHLWLGAQRGLTLFFATS